MLVVGLYVWFVVEFVVYCLLFVVVFTDKIFFCKYEYKKWASVYFTPILSLLTISDFHLPIIRPRYKGFCDKLCSFLLLLLNLPCY